MELNSEDFELILLKHQHQQYASQLGTMNHHRALNLHFIRCFLAAITGFVLLFHCWSFFECY